MGAFLLILFDPLPKTDDSVLVFTVYEGKRKLFSAIPYEFSGPINFRPKQVKLDLIESIEEMPYIVRNNLSNKFKT
ncbi:hypothetical protein [Larkinella rosea]|uniref:Uncharacterized protein n=1 Tax=Larkinella rosea TaxID=2025312 RepID=A0A3P1BJI6_9BACT|nr:hypothetical protein [Larkinella rosea]RRB01152.1 hypothetical protein EHT25_23545 [Larkinella rosea]